MRAALWFVLRRWASVRRASRSRQRTAPFSPPPARRSHPRSATEARKRASFSLVCLAAADPANRHPAQRGVGDPFHLPNQYANIILNEASQRTDMSFFDRLANFFSRGGRDDNLLRQGMDHASANRPEQAIAIYDSLVASKSASLAVRSRALFNRALANSSMKEDEKAIADLEQVMAMSGVPENVVTAARNQLIRVRNRGERHRNREDADRDAPTTLVRPFDASWPNLGPCVQSAEQTRIGGAGIAATQ